MTKEIIRKQISIRENIYIKLRNAKAPGQSFSGCIEELLNERQNTNKKRGIKT